MMSFPTPLLPAEALKASGSMTRRGQHRLSSKVGIPVVPCKLVIEICKNDLSRLPYSGKFENLFSGESIILGR
jgi:hypothetical protein